MLRAPVPALVLCALAATVTACAARPASEQATASMAADTAVYDTTALSVKPSVRNPRELVDGIRGELPDFLQRMGDRGGARVELVVGADGRVENARVLTSSGDAGFDAAVLHAVTRLRFTPGQVKGHAVRSRMVLPVSFRAPGA